MTNKTPGQKFRDAVASENPLQIVGAITAYAGLMARRVGYRALYLSGGGVAANSLGVPDLGISSMEDVLTHADHFECATCGHEWPREVPAEAEHEGTPTPGCRAAVLAFFSQTGDRLGAQPVQLRRDCRMLLKQDFARCFHICWLVRSSRRAFFG